MCLCTSTVNIAYWAVQLLSDQVHVQTLSCEWEDSNAYSIASYAKCGRTLLKKLNLIKAW